MIQILIPSIREDLSGVLASIGKNTTNSYQVCVIREGTSYAQAVNNYPLYGDWIFFGADDIRFYPQWDVEAFNSYGQSGKMVIGTNDLHNPIVLEGNTATHWMVKKEYFDTFGGVIDDSYPLVYNYKHNYIDTEFIETARSRDQFIYSKKSIVEHLHPSWGLADMDPVYRKGESESDADQATYLHRLKLWQK